VKRYGSLLTFVATSFFLSCAGCGPGDMSAIDLPIPTEKASTSEEVPRTLTVPVAAAADAPSPAAVMTGPPRLDAGPDEVCRQFLQALNRENPDQFKLFLTSAALNVANRLKFDLPPVAEADEAIELSSVRFASIRNHVSYVDCRIADSEEKITWMLRKTDLGWRIAGMLVPRQDGTSNLLSFENSVDVTQIRNSLAEQISSSSDES